MPFTDPQVIDLLVPRLHIRLQEYRQAQDPADRYWCHEQLSSAVRHLEFFITPRASKRAQYIADESVGDLSQYTYQNRKDLTSMRLEERRCFAFDHVYPVGQMVEDLLALEPDDLAGIRDLISQMELAWIMPGEDRKLNALGYRQHRDDPYKAYEEAGIELVPLL